MPTMFEAPSPARCSHCGGPVSTRGLAPRDGRRFCSAIDCRAAKARHRRNLVADTREAPTSCAGCGDALPARSWRSGDELGRWCRRQSCLGQRREARAAAAGGIDFTQEREILRNTVDLLTTAVQCDSEENHFSNRLVCHECGLTTALPGWAHPGDEGFTRPCFGTLDGATKRPIGRDGIARGWPFRLQFLSPEDLANLPD